MIREKTGAGNGKKEIWTLAAVLLLVLGFLAFNHYPDSGIAGNSVSWLVEKIGGPSLTGANIAISNAGGATTCGGVNASITLTQDVLSTGTCYIINASNIIVDCAGRNINYSTDSNTPGFGINITAQNNITIRHCVINQITNGGPAIIIDRNTSNTSGHITIYNTTIYVPSRNISGSGLVDMPAIRIRDNSNHTNISHVTIRTTADNATGIFFIDSSHHIVEFTNVTVNGSNARGIWIQNSRNNTLRAVDIRTWNTSAVYIVSEESRDNVIYNSSLIVNMLSSETFVLEDMTPGTLNNSLQFDGALGYINWTKGNISTMLNLSIGETIYIGNNTVGVFDAGSLNMRINETARIAMRGLAAHLGNPQLLRGATRCDNTPQCNVTFDATNNVLEANVSFFSNYSTERGCGLVTENLTLRNDVSTDGTCFTIGANNIVLNCNGPGDITINYSSGGSYGVGINISGYDNTVIRNCVIVEGSSTTNAKHAINISASATGTIIENVSILLSADDSIGVNIWDGSNYTVVNFSFINSSGRRNEMIHLNRSSHGRFQQNVFYVGNGTSNVIVLESAENNTFISNGAFIADIVVEGTPDRVADGILGIGIHLADSAVVNNLFFNNSIQSPSNYTIWDMSNATNLNYLIYNNTNGMINWTKGNLSTMLNISLDTIGISQGTFIGAQLFLEPSELGVLDSPDRGNPPLELNTTAQIRFYRQVSELTPELLRGGGAIRTRCDTTDLCNITSYESGPGRLIAIVSHFSNYSTNAATAEAVTTTDTGGKAAVKAEALVSPIEEFGEEAVQQELEESRTPKEAAALIARALSVSVESVTTGEVLATELTEGEQQALMALYESLSPEERAQLEQAFAGLTGGEAAMAARELLQRQPGLARGVETRPLVSTEVVSIALRNSGKEEIVLNAELPLDELAPALANEENVRGRIREELIAQFSREGREYTAEELERKVQQTVLTIRLMEDRNVKFLLEKVLSLSTAGSAGGTGRIPEEAVFERTVRVGVKNAAALVKELITLLNNLFGESRDSGITGGAVASLPGGPEEKKQAGQLIQSASGISPTGERIAGRLLLPKLLEDKEIVIKPGESIQQKVKLFRGLSSTPREMTLSLTAAELGLEVGRKNVPTNGVIYGGAVDVNREENVMDLYLLLPPGEKDATYMLEVRLLRKAPPKLHKIPLKMSSAGLFQLFSREVYEKHVLYADLYGPYTVRAGREEGIMLGQQLAYDETIYHKAYLLQMRLWKGQELVADQLYPVVLG